MTIDLDALERIARAATPGPWELDGMGADEPEINYWAHRFIGTAEPNESGSHEIVATSEDGHGPNAAHIAAFDPDTVLALIAELRRARECIEKVRDEAERWLDAPRGEAAPVREVGRHFRTLATYQEGERP